MSHDTKHTRKLISVGIAFYSSHVFTVGVDRPGNAARRVLTLMRLLMSMILVVPCVPSALALQKHYRGFAYGDGSSSFGHSRRG